MPEFHRDMPLTETTRRPAGKFSNPDFTRDGTPRAKVDFEGLKTLWVNTGTLCNVTCEHCYIESSPANDRLAYFRRRDLISYLDEITANGWATGEVGFTGGEPFMNSDLPAMLGDVLGRGLRALVLTNAMKPMHLKKAALLELRRDYGDALRIRVSLDHYTQVRHEAERGPGTWDPAIEGIKWLWDQGFNPGIAGRTMWDEDIERLRAGYGELFQRQGIGIDSGNPESLVLFPEMNEAAEVPEITAACWDLLGVDPRDLMCASSRMVVLRKGAKAPAVLACTLIAYDSQFELGETLSQADQSIPLNHPHCAKFCVLGGGSCSGG